eukprot:5682684-Lingulodinium_polyedra.AAC.1
MVPRRDWDYQHLAQDLGFEVGIMESLAAAGASCFSDGSGGERWLPQEVRQVAAGVVAIQAEELQGALE